MWTFAAEASFQASQGNAEVHKSYQWMRVRITLRSLCIPRLCANDIRCTHGLDWRTKDDPSGMNRKWSRLCANGRHFRLSAKIYSHTLASSSPRGRGTVAHVRAQILCLRFIPAWAGNRHWHVLKSAALSVHPRVGGEQINGTAEANGVDGSSPRGRGTVSCLTEPLRYSRFIPAWAGNRQDLRSQGPRPAVHPRVGGEQDGSSICWNFSAGSSPRGRGTVIFPFSRLLSHRFIPAWAGNSQHSACAGARLPVHPRVGGEQSCGDSLVFVDAGSSPRGRGTEHRPSGVIAQRRFIPAWAGNR